MNQKRSAGRLSGRRKIAYMASAIGTAAADPLRNLARATPQGAQALAGRPDTQLTRAVEQLAVDAYETPLLNHCLRTWSWGCVLAAIDDVAFDEELFYSAALLHDIGLTPAHQPGAGEACFAFSGGRQAKALMLDQGATTWQAELVEQAIALHMDLKVPLEAGPEAHLVHAGAYLDVVGRRVGDIPVDTVREVLRTYPRSDFADQCARLLRREASERPNSRAAAAWASGMKVPLGRNPLDAHPSAGGTV